MRLAAAALAIVALPPAGGATPAAPPASCVAVPFDQQVDLDAVVALANAPPQDLLALVDRMGIDLRRVPDATPGRPVNPLLAALPAADDALLRHAQWLDGYEGRAIPLATGCCGLVRDTVLIRETARTYTLLHELVHLLIVPADRSRVRNDVELRFALAFRRLQVYQRRLYGDPWRLLDPAWRRDIVEAQREVASLLFERIRIGQSQEAIVERLLARCVDERSPYHDADRREEGRRYGIAMIDNAIDVYNELDAAIEYNHANVTRLREEIVAGRVREGPDARLSAREHDEFVAHQQAVRDAMARTRVEIEALKRFFSQ